MHGSVRYSERMTRTALRRATRKAVREHFISKGYQHITDEQVRAIMRGECPAWMEKEAMAVMAQYGYERGN